MPIQYEYDDIKNILYEKGTGEVTLSELLDYRKTLVNIPFRSGARGFADYMQAEVDLSYEEIKRVSAATLNAIEELDDLKFAICANSVLGYGVARMFSILSEKMNFDVSVFKTLEEAQAWLGLSNER